MEGLAELARFLPEFERPAFEVVEWQGGEILERNEDGIPHIAIEASYVVYSTIVKSFIESAYRHGWVSSDFDWPAWAQSPEAARLRDDEEALAHATEEELGRLLTVYIRGDRFSEGALLDAFESGLILRIARRAKALADGSPSREPG